MVERFLFDFAEAGHGSVGSMDGMAGYSTDSGKSDPISFCFQEELASVGRFNYCRLEDAAE